MNFSKRVALVCAAIPDGRVATYGQIAVLCGGPRRARQVGQALRRGASPAAYRVVNRQGFLSGAASFPVPELQRQLLEAEGVEVDSRQTVDLERFLWRPGEKETQALERAFEALNI